MFGKCWQKSLVEFAAVWNGKVESGEGTACGGRLVAKHRDAEGVLMGLGQGEHLMGFSKHGWNTAGGSTAGWEWPPLHILPWGLQSWER